MTNDEIDGHLMALEAAIVALGRECAERLPGLGASLERSLLLMADATEKLGTHGKGPEWNRAKTEALLFIGGSIGFRG